ncbi:MAG TPA: alpha/beta fold hydrolase [Jatrophihabitans sp.]|nr:alpha/beta fold hydrolase [Jatrophihabitans sp.]
MFASLAPARRRLVLLGAAVLALVVAVTTAVIAGRAGADRSAGRQVSQQVAGPVLVLPGYGGSITGISVLAHRLRTAGKDVTVVNLPDNAQGDLAGQAEVLAAAAKAAIGRTGAPSVDVVGYSAGGVVARLWAKQYGGARLARRIVTLGSPQHGTALASLGSLLAGECPPACQQLIPTSPILSRLNTRPEVPAGPVFVSLWTSKDEVVLPPQSAELAGAVNIEIQSVCPTSTVDHSQLPTDPLVGRMVAAELGSGAAVPLGAGDCARLSS